MANLNIPFVLLQKDTCQFSPAIGTSKLIHYSKFNLRDSQSASSTTENIAASDNESQASASSTLLGYIGGVFSNVTGQRSGETLSTKSTKAPIQFDNTRENLLVLADQKTGCLALCSHELHSGILPKGGIIPVDDQAASQDNQKQCGSTRLLINIQPRVLLLPSLVADQQSSPGPLLSHCMVRCPAPNILNASLFWLCTLHSDNRLRLWNTDDGRCISISPSKNFLVDTQAKSMNNEFHQQQQQNQEAKSVKGLAVAAIVGFPGQIFLFADNSEVCIVDVYKMQVQTRVKLENSRGFTGCQYLAEQNTLVFCDGRGAIYLIQDKLSAANNRVRVDEFRNDIIKNGQVIQEESKLIRQSTSKSGGNRRSQHHATGQSSSQMAAQQKRMLKFCRNGKVTNFQFKMTIKLGGRETLEVGRLKQSQTLAYDFDLRTKSIAVVVSQDQIEQVIVNEEAADRGKAYIRQPLKQFTDDTILVFAEFIRAPQKDGKKFLVCINVSCEVLIYDMTDLQRPKFDLTEQEKAQFRCNFVQPIKTLKLLEGCPVTDYHQIWIKDSFSEMTSEHRTKEEHLQSRLDRLQEHLLDIFKESERCELFNYSREEHLLYSFIKVHNKNVLIPQDTNLLLSWDLRHILGGDSKLLPLNISNLTLFGSQSKQNEPHIPNSLIPFNSQVLKSFYNSCQFRFFFTDESVTAQVIFQDRDSPSSIIGTNYGRIFMIPMFQEQQFKHVVPTILIDSHNGSPIRKLYLAYQGASDEGGHLLSISEDGTICATDLKAESIAKRMYGRGPTHVQTSQRRRTDQFMHEKGKNMRLQRRHSVSQYFSAEDFFKYERVRATEVFEEMAFSPVKHIFRIKSFQEAHDFLINARSTRQRSKPKLELPKQHYALITDEREALILTIHTSSQGPARFQLTKLPLMSEPTIGIFLDQASQSLFILGEKDLSWRQFCLRSHSLNQRRRSFTDALIMLEVPQLVETLMQSNDHFFRQMRPDDCDLLSFENFQKDFNKAKILKGLGTHQCLDFLNLSLSVPFCYSPQQHLLKEYTGQLRYLLSFKRELMSFQESEESQKSMLRAVNYILNWDADLVMKSDATRKQASVIALETQGSNFCGSSQQVLIASTLDMLPTLQSKMKRIKALQDKSKPLEITEYFGANGSKGAERPKTEAAGMRQANGSPDRRLINTGQQQQQQSQDFRQTSAQQDHQKQSYGMDRYRWPSKILSLVHPFNLHDGMDESLEEFFNLNMPFLDFRIGIQGIEEAFSFVITKEDRNYHNERDHISKIMGLLKISRQLRRWSQQTQKQLVVENFIEQHIDPQDSTLYLGRFFNSEYWKMSPYLSTIVPAFLLSSFVSIIEYDEKEICLLSQVWLDIVHHIRHASKFKQSCASPLRSPTTLSTSVLSQLLLLQDLNVSSCAKDIIFKPMLCHQSEHDKHELQTEISDWLALVIDTYEELKQETTAQQEGGPDGGAPGRGAASGGGGNANVGGDHAVENIMRMTMGGPQERPPIESGGASGAAASRLNHHGSNEADHNSHDQHLERRQGAQENRPLSHFFGELEIKGLINISFYAFYCQVDPSQQLGQRDLDRVSKLVVILIREVVQQFQDRKDYIHLLTILLYLLQCNLKTATANFKRKAIMEDVVRLLLFIFNYYKPPLNRELFITRVTSENFNLIRPTNSELYLKLVAAKTLLEIGVSFTEEFLQLIQFHATTLRPSHEHQKNVLETLRYFINGYGENLEKYLIQIVQILLRCLDPNELALRKNSHKYVSVILSNMVKIFPMVAFHYDTQRLAVGTHDGPIGIYDVRTSAKWKILEGHTKNVTCLCFDSKGNYLASYSAVDLTLKLWKVGNTSFFAVIMGGTGRWAKQIKLTNLGSNVANPHVHTTQAPNHIEMENRDRKFQETNEISRGDGAGDGSSAQNSAGDKNQSNANSGNRISRCHIKFLRNDKDVELIREDGSKELHSLIK